MEIGDHVRHRRRRSSGLTGNHKHVIACTAREGVGAQVAAEGVVAQVAEQLIIALAAPEAIVVLARSDGVVATVAIEAIAPPIPQQHIIPAQPQRLVIAPKPCDQVRVCTTGQDIVVRCPGLIKRDRCVGAAPFPKPKGGKMLPAASDRPATHCPRHVFIAGQIPPLVIEGPSGLQCRKVGTRQPPFVEAKLLKMGLSRGDRPARDRRPHIRILI